MSTIFTSERSTSFERMLVGGVLAGAGKGSAHMVDAHGVAAAVESGGGVCLTTDSDDLSELATPYTPVQVVDVNRSQ